MADRVRQTWTVAVDRPQEEVFDYLADVKRHGEWSPKPYRVEDVPDGPVGIGTKFVSYGWIPGDKEHRNDAEVTAFNRPDSLVIRATEKESEFINTFRLASEGSRTIVEKEMDMPKPGGALGMVFPVLLKRFIRPQVQKGMDMLKANVEKNGG